MPPKFLRVWLKRAPRSPKLNAKPSAKRLWSGKTPLPRIMLSPPKITAAKKTATTSKAKPKVPKLTVKHMLYPELTPGEKCDVQSRSINGTFRIDAVTHEGDNWGDDWTSTVEATQVAQ